VSSTLRVGFVGLGTMGVPMARNLARKGFPLTVSSRTSSKAEALAKELPGVVAAASAAEAADGADVVVSCVPDSPDVLDVHLGARGALSRMKAGAIAIDCSTIAPEAARTVAARLAERGAAFLDAPVSGGQKGAQEGTLTFFVGGEKDALERAMPVFLAMGKRVTHLGPSGAGQLGKAANQILVACNLVGVSEALVFAEKHGLPLEALHGALTAGAATSWSLEVLGKKMLARDFAPAFAIRHQQKDLAILLEAARAKGVPLPGTSLAHQLLSALEAEGRGDDGTQALLTLYEKLASISRP
jgi:3-hydroxyisobutyrate dehydrogenase-like beta-hydroxyacid dehydrogenase